MATTHLHPAARVLAIASMAVVCLLIPACAESPQAAAPRETSATARAVVDVSPAPAATALTEVLLDNPGGEQAVFSGDGSRLLLASDAEAQVWDTATWKRIGPVIPLGRLPRIALDEKGKRALITWHIEVEKSGWPDFAAHTESAVWDVDAGRQLRPIIWRKGRSVGGPALSRDGNIVARIGEDPAPRVGARQAVHLLHADTMEEFCKLEDPMPWPSPGSEPNGDRAIVRDSSYFAEFNPERVNSVRFHRDGSLMVMGSLGSIHKWDVEKVKLLASREFSGDFLEAITDNDLVLFNRIGGFAVHELVTGRKLLEDSYYKYDFRGMQIGDDGTLVGVTLSVSEPGTQIWDVNTGQKLALLPELIVLHPRGGMVAASTRDEAGVWDVISGQRIRKPKAEGYYTKAVFCPDGSRLALIGSKGTVVLLARPGVKGVESWK